MVDYRKKGIATEMVKRGMKVLMDEGCDVAFLSVDLSKGLYSLYEQLGFHFLKQKFAWKNINGKIIEESEGGMLATANSEEIFNDIIKSKEVFYVGEGYW